MAFLVRDAAMRDEGLCAFAARLLIDKGLDSHSSTDEILDCVFQFIQKRTKYIADPGGSFDAVSSARETLSKKPVPYGDCDDLSVLLASLLACLGFEPSFVLAKYRNDEAGFDHIYVQVETEKGGIVTLDPTTRTHGIGWESPKAIERLVFPIFGRDGGFNSLAGAMSTVATTGVQIGVSAIPVVGPLLSAFVPSIASLFDRSAQRAQETSRDELARQVREQMSVIQQAIDECKITAAQGADFARQIVAQYYQVCDQNFKSSVARSCRNHGTEPGGFDQLTQSIVGRLAPNCAIASSPTATTGNAQAAVSANNGGLGGLSVSPLTALLLLGGGLLFVKALK